VVRTLKLPIGRQLYAISAECPPFARRRYRHSHGIGPGSIPCKAIFEAAKSAGVKLYFVEQEQAFEDMPPLEAIKADYDHLHCINA
jgi:hypothetical protein